MSIETETPPLRLAEFNVKTGFLEQGTTVSTERLVQSEMALRGTVRPIDTTVTMAGVFLSSISSITLVLAEIYRHLDGAITGQLGAAPPLQRWLIAGTIVGLALIVGGRFVLGPARGRSRLTHQRRQRIREI